MTTLDLFKMKNKTKNYKLRTTNKRAFTLIEALVVLFIFSLITVTFYSVFSLGTRYIQDAKNRLGAIAIANEKMEIIRNLKYDDIGTVNGIPSGNIPADEDVSENTRSFHIKTFVQYDDDPFDEVAPDDAVPNDYKRVKVTVSWTGSISSGSVFLVSRFVPQGIEVSSGDGTLAINVIDGQGAGVAQATVHIVNNSLSPNVNITAQTDNTGNLMLPGAKESMLGYELTVSKNSYETVDTVDPNDVAYVANDTHASVVKGLLNTKDIKINKTINLKIKAVDSSATPISALAFKLKGGRELGADTSEVPAEIIYNLDIISATESDGEKDFNEKSSGQYFLSRIGSVAGYSFVGVDGSSSLDLTDPNEDKYVISMAPAEDKTVKIKFADDNADSLFIKIQKEDGTLISGAEVTVKNGAGYDKTQISGADGFAFFPDTSDVFSPGDYTIEVKASGYNDANETVAVDKLTAKEIKLTAI